MSTDKITFRIPGVWTQDVEGFEDERGSFSPIITDETGFPIKEMYVANTHEGYLRGLHFQMPPYPQNKIVCCVDGLIEDIIVDLRKSSPTYGDVMTFFMEGSSPYLVHIPAGCAHGYYAYRDSTVIYCMDEVFHPESYGGIKWDSCLIALPSGVKTSIKDAKLPRFCNFETPFI
jgi:dTDP-4-dehydrorhamnose 3,5-epimerase